MPPRPPRGSDRPDAPPPVPGAEPLHRSGLPSLSAGEAAAVLAALQRIHLQMLRPAQVAGLLRTAAEEVAVLLASRSATICLPDGPETLRMQMGTGALAVYEGDVLPIGASLAGAAFRGGEPQRAVDIGGNPELYWPLGRSGAMGPALALPLLAGEQALGALLVTREAGAAPFDERDEARALPIADALAVALHNAQTFEQARASREQMEAWRREVELRRWLTRYESAFGQQGAVVFEWDVEGDRLVWGGSAHEVLNLYPGELGSTPDEWVQRVHEADRAAVTAALQGAAESGQELRVRCRVQDGAGDFLPMELHARSAQEAKSTRVVGALRSVPDVEFASEESARLGAPTAERIIHALRHEINNPLAVIMGQAQLLTNDPAISGDASLQQSVSAIFNESQRIDILIKRLAAVEGSVGELGFHSGGGFQFPASVLN